MKLTCIAIALMALALPARAQDAADKSQTPQNRQRSGSDSISSFDAEKSRARAQLQEEQAAQAYEAVVRAAQEQQNTAVVPPNGGGGSVGMMPGGRPVKSAWLGVSASSPPPALRRQLKLPDGTGLVVDFVQPKSPAEQAGIRQYDLLVKLNDQLLINPEQLAVLVRTFKPGEVVHVSLFREGEKQRQDVTLVERDLPPLNELQMQLFDDFNARSNPGPAPRIHAVPFGGAQGTSGTFIAPGGAVVQRSERSLTWLDMDGKRQITVNLGDDEKTMTMTDTRTGRVIYQGPVDSAEQQKSLPRDARDAVERLKNFLKTAPQSNVNDGSNKPKQGS
jgi:hypothetical protein